MKETAPHIGTLREKPLHASLKRWYTQTGDRVEVRVDGFVIDIVRDDLLIEVQTRGFSSMKRKVEKGRRFTYAELDARANRIAHVLRAKGVRKGDRVALLLMNGVEYLEAYFGAAKIGAVMVPLNWRLVPDELEFIIGDAGAVVLIYGEEFDDSAKALQPREFPSSSGSAAATNPRCRTGPTTTRR